MKEKSQIMFVFCFLTLCSMCMFVLISSPGFGADNHIKAEFSNQPQLDGQKAGKIYKTESYPADGHAVLKAGDATDKEDFYRADKRKIRLFRSLRKLVLWTKNKQLLDISSVNLLLDSESTVELEKKEPLKSVNVLKTKKRMTPAKLDTIVHNLRQSNRFERVNPLFLNEETGTEMIVTSRIIVKLAEGISAKQIAPILTIHSAQVVGHMHGAPEEVILDLGEATAEEILNICETYQQNPLVEWASPDFLFELDLLFTPDDPLYLSGNQWHLNNTGQSGGNPDADVDAPEAWDISTGSSNIAIAIIDTGVELTHPDLDDNIYTNEAEASGTPGIDDDGNGYVDDIHGWDFYSNDNNPNPGSINHPHGTCCAGVAAAEGDNATGVAGIAYNCLILPVKISSDSGTFASYTAIGNAIRYAADMAHVLSNSWRTAASSTIHSAIQYAVNTKGKPVFFASGNDASGWIKFTLSGFPSGTFTFTWTYTKNTSINGGDDTVWLDDVTFPGGASEGFEGATFPPSGWSSGGDANWTQYEEASILEDRLHVRWTGIQSAKAGNITHNQTTYLQTTRAVGAGDLTFYAWVSSQASFDKFEFTLNGYTYFTYSGVPAINYDVGYPARYAECFAVGASTDHDYRSQYSQYDETLDHVLAIVAPSNGGNWGIATTDITGSGGYDTGDYTNPSGSGSFGGTSSACPLAAGVAALLLSLNPNLNPSEIIQIIKDTADKIGSVTYTDGYNKYYGYGRVNAHAALAAAVPVISITVNPGTWNIANTNLGEIEETEFNYFTAENNGNVAEDFAITCGNSVSGDWFCVETITDSEQFTMNAQGGLLTTWTSIHASVPLAQNVAAPVGDNPGGTVEFDLQFTAPTATEHMDSPQEIVVTITASEHI